MFKPIKRSKLVLVVILAFVLLTRFWRLNYPQRFMFDEVYHAFTAQAYAKNDPRGYEWWHQSPVEGTAYEWLHPPISKLLMATGIILFGDNSFGWRVFSAFLGTVCVLLVFLIARELFKEENLGLLTTFIFAMDGLALVQSRIAMNDIFLTCFSLAAFYFLVKFRTSKKIKTNSLLMAGFFIGLAISTKWTGIYNLLIVGVIFLSKGRGWLKKFLAQPKNWVMTALAFVIMPILIYLLSYGQFWLQGHTWDQFVMLHKQIWWYQTNLTATHTYQSSALSWPILARPVWFFVDYQPGSIANIYAMGNPLVWWGGLISLPFVIWQMLKRRYWQLGLVIFAYFAFFLPWALSPRIMFIYHYLPSIPFLCLFLGWALNWGWRKKKLFPIVAAYLLLVLILFFFFYPHWTGLHVPKWLDNLYYWFPSWK